VTIDDLRRELADIIRYYEGDGTLHGSSADEVVDEVLAAMAQWLRRKAERHREVMASITQVDVKALPAIRASECDHLANELERVS